MLIELDLMSYKADPLILPDSFLGGFAPSLRLFSLWGIPFPAMRKLLSTTRELVTLALGFITPSGLISPYAMVDILSTLTKLKTFDLIFNSRWSETPQFWDHGVAQRPPALTPVFIPALANFNFYGNSKYLEGIVSRIDAPLDCFVLAFSDKLGAPDIPLLRDFIGHTKILNGPHRVDTSFSSVDVEISLFRRKGGVDFKVLNLRIPCSPDAANPQLSLLAEACSTLLPSLPSLQLLGIFNSKRLLSRWQHKVDNIIWMELLRPFTTVKDLVLDELVVLSVATFLQELVEEQVTETLPALQNIFLDDIRSSGPVPEGFAKFVASRELSGRAVILHHRETKG